MENSFSKDLRRRDFIKWSALALGAAIVSPNSLAQAEMSPAKSVKASALKSNTLNLPQEVLETVTAKDFTALIGQVKGLSENQLRQHFKLYENYVNKINQIHHAIAQASDEMLTGSNASYSAYRELLVEQSFMQNGVTLHELYFGNLGPATEASKELQAMITRDFGSWTRYMQHLMAAGKAMRGWAMTCLNLRTGKLQNYGLDTHSQGMPDHVYPLLVLDVYEHAYLIDFGTDRAKYLEIFTNNINWSVVHNRLIFAVHHVMTGLMATQ